MLWACLECTTRYAFDLQACPHCGSAERQEDGMPKITVARGATYPPDDTTNEEETAEWPGKLSSASTKKRPSTPETSETTLQSPAPTTESRYVRARKASSSAVSTATSGPETVVSEKK